MTVYQHARELAENIMKTEEAATYYSIRDCIGESNNEQYEKALCDFTNLVNEVFSIIRYTIGEENISCDKPDSVCNHVCGCKK